MSEDDASPFLASSPQPVRENATAVNKRALLNNDLNFISTPKFLIKLKTKIRIKKRKLDIQT